MFKWLLGSKSTTTKKSSGRPKKRKTSAITKMKKANSGLRSLNRTLNKLHKK